MDDLVDMAARYIVGLCYALGDQFVLSGILESTVIAETKERRFSKEIPAAFQRLVKLGILEEYNPRHGKVFYRVVGNWDNRFAILAKAKDGCSPTEAPGQ
jgi:hypothetical protein